MPRTFGKVNVAIWNDPEFRDLPPAAQHLYLLLWTSPDLSFCGVHDWRPGRLTKLSKGFTEEHTRTVAACLQARHFLVVDDETEEVLVRSWARFDETLKQPRLAVSYSAAYAATYSPTLRQVLAHETAKMRKLWPELTCWDDARVTQILEHPAISAKKLPTPEDPFGDHFGDGFGLGLAQTSTNVSPSVSGSVSLPPTTAPTTTSTNRVGSTRKRAVSLPDDFAPNETNRRIADEHRVDLARMLPQFMDHHRAKGTTMKDWNAALNTWIRREKPSTTQPGQPSLPSRSQAEQPPDGLTDAEYDEWWAAQRARRHA